MYRIAKDVRLPSRSADRDIAGLCDCRRDAEGGRKDQRDGAWFDRNRLRSGPAGLWPPDTAKFRTRQPGSRPPTAPRPRPNTARVPGRSPGGTAWAAAGPGAPAAPPPRGAETPDPHADRCRTGVAPGAQTCAHPGPAPGCLGLGRPGWVFRMVRGSRSAARGACACDHCASPRIQPLAFGCLHTARQGCDCGRATTPTDRVLFRVLWACGAALA